MNQKLLKKRRKTLFKIKITTAAFVIIYGAAILLFGQSEKLGYWISLLGLTATIFGTLERFKLNKYRQVITAKPSRFEALNDAINRRINGLHEQYPNENFRIIVIEKDRKNNIADITIE